jgi:dTDP-4-amino-4,6-dideoxygalactose transaminase
MVLTNRQDIYEKIKILRNQGNAKKYYHSMLGFNNRLDSIQAAVLNVKLKYLDSWNKKRQENAEYFSQRLKDAQIKTPTVAGYTTHIYHQYVLRLNGSSEKLVEYLNGKGIDARVYYPVPLHLQECFGCLGYKKGDFPESEKASLETLAVPVYPDLTRQEMEYIVESIREFLQ